MWYYLAWDFIALAQFILQIFMNEGFNISLASPAFARVKAVTHVLS